MSELQPLPSWMKQASGYICPSPVAFDFEGEMWQRDCGRCLRCEARKKRDVQGRAAAEAAFSAECCVWTLTYAPLEPFPRDGRPWVQTQQKGAADFVTKHRQDFLKRFRQFLWDEAARKVGAPHPLRRITTKRGVRYHHFDEHVAAYWRNRIVPLVPRVRYLGCGERGKNRTHRCHWHVVLFLSKTSGFCPTPLETKRDGGTKPGHETHALWPWGFVNVDVINGNVDRLKPKALPYGVAPGPENHQSFRQDEFGQVPDWAGSLGNKMKAARYCIKYLTKSQELTLRERRAGLPAPAKFFRSTATPLGFEYLTELARQHAREGLPVKGTYRIPGVTFSRGRFHSRLGCSAAPRMVEFQLQGRMRDHFIEAYRAECELREPGRDIRLTPWLERFCPSGDYRRAPRGWGETDIVTGRPTRPKPPPRPDRSGLIMVNRGREGVVGMVVVRRSGFAVFKDREGVEHPIPHGNVRDLVQLDHAAHCEIENKLALLRGSDWIEPRELKRLRFERQLAQREAILRFAKEGPAIGPAHRPGERPMTALRRKLLLKGNGHVPGVVVRDPRGGPRDPAFVRGVTELLRPVSGRPT